MLNPMIVLPNGTDAAVQFESQLQAPNKCFFLVLGNTDEHKNLATAAEQQAEDWRYVIWAKDPQQLYARLLTLPLRPGVLPIIAPWPPTIYAISISMSNNICRIVNSANPAEIAPAFLLAETYMQP